MTSEICNIIIKNGNLLSVNRELLHSQCLKDEAVYKNVISQCNDLGIVINVSHKQQQALLGYIRHLSCAAKRLNSSKRKLYLNKFYDWTVDGVTQNVTSTQKKVDELLQDKIKLLERIAQLEQEAKDKERKLVEEKTRSEKLKHRPSSYKIKRNAITSPYSKSHKHRIKRKVQDLASQYDLDSTKNAKENVAPATACRMVDSANLSLRQYHQITQHVPQTPKLHRIKAERKRSVYFHA